MPYIIVIQKVLFFSQSGPYRGHFDCVWSVFAMIYRQSSEKAPKQVLDVIIRKFTKFISLKVKFKTGLGHKDKTFKTEMLAIKR